MVHNVSAVTHIVGGMHTLGSLEVEVYSSRCIF